MRTQKWAYYQLKSSWPDSSYCFFLYTFSASCWITSILSVWWLNDCLSSVQRVLSRCSSDLAEGEAEGLSCRCVPASCSFYWRSTSPVVKPESLQILSSHVHLHWASCWQVPLGQQIPILVFNLEIGIWLLLGSGALMLDLGLRLCISLKDKLICTRFKVMLFKYVFKLWKSIF